MMSHGKIILTHLREFLKDNKGSVAVEAAIILPMLFWVYAAMFIFFDVFRTRSTVEKAAYTVSDMLSRETNAINTAYLLNAHKLFDVLAGDSSTPSGLRVSLVSWDDINEEYDLEWSQATGGMVPLDQAGLALYESNIPVMAIGETLIIVQTENTYEPVLNVGLGNIDMKTFIFTRPRFASQIVWES